MRLVRAAIRRMPGLAEGYTLDALELVVLLVGPNGSGKSTLRRALQALLWPERETSLDVELSFEWTDGEGSLLVERVGRDVSWSRAGVPCAPPSLPAADLAPSFSFGSEDLVGGGSTAQEQAREVAAELAGGYALEPLIERRAITSGSQRRVHTTWAEARERVTRFQRVQLELAEEERELAGLVEELERAKRASSRRARVESALELARALESERVAEARLAEFPAGLERLAGDELTRLERLAETRAGKVEEQGKATVRTRRAESEAVKLRLSPDIDESSLKAAERALDDLREVENRLAEDTAQLGKLRERRDEAAASLGGSGAPPPLTVVDAERVQSFVEARWRLRSEEIEAEGQLAQLRRAERGRADPEAVRQAAHEVRASLSGARRAVLFWWLISLVATLAAGGSAWAAFRGELWPASPIAALLFAAAALGCLWMGRRTPGQGAIRDALRHAQVEEPASCSREQLKRVLRVLDEEIAAREDAARAQARVSDLEARLEDLGPRREALEAERRSLREDCGFDPGLRELGLHELAALMRQWRTLHDDVERAAGVVAGRERRVADIVATLDALMRSAEVSCEPTGAAYRAELDRLAARFARARQLAADAEASGREADRLAGEIRLLDEERGALLRRAGLAEDDTESLRDRVARLEAFRDAQRSLDQARTLVLDRRTRLGMDAGEDPGPVDALEAELEELRRLSEPEERLRDELARVRARVGEARSGHGVEDALASEEAARAAVVAEREAELDDALGAFLLRRAAKSHARGSMPPRLAHASALLQRFTGQRYALELDGDLDSERAFVARDLVEEKILPLDGLSSGTRAQLLLAARVAFATAVEGTQPLPLFLDETLSQADPERFRAVAHALLMLAREGRQVFYLTCQPADAALWREQADLAGADFLGVRDLARLRGLEWGARAPEHEPARRPLPSPAGLSPLEYASVLGVPPLDPFRNSSAAHLFHALAEELPLLHALLEAAIERVGQWRALEEGDAAAALVGGARGAEAVRARVRALTVFLDAWRQGRGTPLDREALAAANVSETFMDQVITLAEQENWDAARLVAALRNKQVKRFRAAAIDALEESFLESGHLDPAELLDVHQLRTRVITALVPELEDGVLTRAELSALVERWLAGVAGHATCRS